MGDWQPDKTITAGDGGFTDVHLWTITEQIKRDAGRPLIRRAPGTRQRRNQRPGVAPLVMMTTGIPVKDTRLLDGRAVRDRILD